MTSPQFQRVFLNSANQLMGNASFIKPIFPPKIDLWELITKHIDSSDSCKNSRSPNAFMIYRKVFVETARRDGYQLPMRVVSSLASKSWLMEPESVKLEYKRLSREANELRDKMLPKAIRKRKKQKWNIISFSSTSSTSNIKNDNVVNKRVKKKLSKKKRLNTKPTKKVEPSAPSPPPNESVITFNIPCDVSSPIVDLDSDSGDNLSLPYYYTNSDYQQSQQQPQDLQEYVVFNTFNTVDFTIDSIDSLNEVHNGDFEYNSPGFLTFYDDLDCYPSFWFEY